MLKAKRNQSVAGGADVAQYLKTAPVGAWMVLVLVAVLLACGVAWSMIGTIRTSMALTGVNEGGHVTCYVRPVDAISLNPGLPVALEGQTVGVVARRDTVALSREEAAALIDNAYLSAQLGLSENNTAIYLDIDPYACPDGVVRLDVVLAEMRPFDLLFG